ncbi:DUF5107 domain-containing protein [Mucilaginibacter sp. UR6-1]|uniref:tetratricopeptide repeat protein n=1 Tax=Mucilaginibacter sp. UR6-1 TaxID=1435643 RepID=UPI001E502A21|nr:DUF5107 domain-containing protein [Mucilaginibacter sp. UR6-1]MCC8409122.1 DUF5107 domain-containing protein [Mucilaginibacter sp. UR6-1]
MEVKAWIEKVIIPTYGIGTPDKNPMFFEKRVYQGSSGVVYPNPVIEKIFDEKQDRDYTGVFLENAYLKIMILPELGGRVQMAYDKIRERHFIYYNQVIKPALVGLCGPWISGGIEFNWPQHHRPSTFDPVDFDIEHNADGSITVWVSELEKMFHTKGMAGFTLHPDYAYLEIKAKLFNATPLPQTFLWWANPAVKVNDHYQSVFPPDVNAVFDHGKRDVSSFPIATGTYYKVDYSPGTDISMYKNIPVPTSYMAVNSSYDFVGGYEHDTQAGMLHVADHHVSPGKKQWTWGNGDFGVAWDRNLTDEDGPYIELMTGVFTDNQPDFTWLMPFEEKTFTQYFLPYRELGLISNANKDLLLSVQVNGGAVAISLFATTALNDLRIAVNSGEQVLFEQAISLKASEVYRYQWQAEQPVNSELITVTIHDSKNNLLLDHFVKQAEKDIPKAAVPALFPEELQTTEELFLTGQHLEQYRHATFSPVPYYEKALELNAKDIRNNNALGAWYLKRGRFDKAEGYFRTAVEALTVRNPNPYDGEPYFNLGLSLFYQGRMHEAYDAFFKATWNSAWQDAAYHYVAKIDMQRGHYQKALEHINWALDRNARNGRAYLIKVEALTALGKFDEAIFIAEQAIERDRFNYGVLYALAATYTKAGDTDKAKATLHNLLNRSRRTNFNLIECAIEYLDIYAYNDVREILNLAGENEAKDPLIDYYRAYASSGLKNHQISDQYLLDAEKASPDYCFPNRLHDIIVLEHAVKRNENSAKANYYLGNLYYDKRQYSQAIEYWTRSYQLDSDFPTVNRNLGIALFNKSGNPEAALFHLEKAFALDKADARVLLELDQLYKRINKTPEFRLRFLEENRLTAIERDDLYLEIVTLHNLLGHTEQAFELLMQRKFHPWEGGEGKVSAQYIFSLTEMAKKLILAGEYKAAVERLQQSLRYPENLGEGKLPGTRDNDIYFWLGCAYRGMGMEAEATAAWQAGTSGDEEPSAAVFYNDSPPEKIFYQGLCLLKTGESQHAGELFKRLVAYGHQHMNDHIRIDYFAVSLPDLMVFDSDLDMKNKTHCLYLMALGNLGLNNPTESNLYFHKVLESETAHLGAIVHSGLLQNERLMNAIHHKENTRVAL